MSSFHCPIGVSSYLSAGCIECKMCVAQSFPEFREASEIMKKHIQETNNLRDNRPIRKICISGKGGVGKSTITSILANLFADKGYKVLVLDTDESNPSLFRKLGLAKEPLPLLSFLDRFSMQYGIPEDTWLSKDEISLSDIPEEFLVTKGSISLMEIGKIDDPFQGCACSMADLSRQLMKNLLLQENEVVIVDLEAGVESFGRGIEQGVDTIITVAEPSFDSLELAKKIKDMSNGIGIRRAYTIINKLPKKEMLDSVLKVVEGSDISILGAVELHPEITESSLQGKPLGSESSVFKDINKMVETILNSANYNKI